MLILSRRTEETIVINENIRIKILEVRGDKVRIGIVAPKDMPVDREEIHLTRLAERRQAFLNETKAET